MVTDEEAVVVGVDVNEVVLDVVGVVVSVLVTLDVSVVE